MKTKIAVLFLMLLFLSGCAVDNPMLNTSEDLPATQIPVVVPPTVAPEATVPETSAPTMDPIVREPYLFIPDGNYVFISGLFVGCYADGQWVSAEGAEFSLAGFLQQEVYYGYSQTERIDESAQIEVWYDEEWVSIFRYPGDDERMSPYADENDEQSKLMIFNLPLELPQALHDVTIEPYNTRINLGIRDGDFRAPLIMSADHDPLPKFFREIKEPYKEDLAAVAAELTRLGIPGAPPNITECFEIDFLGNGNKERIIVANTIRSEISYPLVTKAELDRGDSGYYTAVLRKSNKGYDTVLSWCMPYNEDENPYLEEVDGGYAYYCSNNEVWVRGIFDLNNDGVYEICIGQFFLDHGYYYVLSRDGDGKWQNVFLGSHGLP